MIVVVAVATLAGLLGLIALGSDTDDDAAAAPSTTSTTGSPSTTTSKTPFTTASATQPAPGDANAALAKLATLAVKGRAPKTGYSRDQFGQAWSDDVTVDGGHNGCDTRNDILRRDLTSIELKPGSNGCVVLSGTLQDPYTDTTIAFVRGEDTSAAVQIDHLVALSDAWQKGAQQLGVDERRNFANDPRNLQAVDGSVNQQKGDGDAATWLPPNRSYRCTYVSRQIGVKALYRLWVTPAEKDAMTRILTACGGVPVDSTTADQPTSTPEDTAPPAITTTEPDTGDGGVYYANCSAARAAGVAPLHVGEPGYRPGLDGDNDGVACE
ncbi:hypothetical protein GORHZ_084_00520 [Gordonia rhizosphera NBRC 16068]|uniref:Excalibur calcium-binding domain-containing protein n=1 Tax=Gordonia rhizosphera NBRC 16068 TaxID=1108045 RepID=K6WU87_9ACTN|nr:hypothetical protein GORHZ_084_00520 [Gordonia rhizosphera NBRC 16068]